MARLIETTPCAGLLPQTIGRVELTEVLASPVTLVAPFAGQQKAVSNALKSAIGVGFPNPNRTLGTDPRVVWCGMGQALVIGADCPDLTGLAAVVDQSDAWTMVQIKGSDARDVLARLTPIDLRDSQFKRGHTARTLLGHMTVSITRVGASTYDVMAMRSMAGTLVHDLTEAATGVAGRASLPQAD